MPSSKSPAPPAPWKRLLRKDLSTWKVTEAMLNVGSQSFMVEALERWPRAIGVDDSLPGWKDRAPPQSSDSKILGCDCPACEMAMLLPALIQWPVHIPG